MKVSACLGLLPHVYLCVRAKETVCLCLYIATRVCLSFSGGGEVRQLGDSSGL